MTEASPTQRLRDVTFGRDVRVMEFVNLYGCSIGDETLIGPFVEIQDDVRIGRRCKIESHSFVCSGTRIGDEVFVGHHVSFTNDRRPAATTPEGELKSTDDWKLEPVVVEDRASIGTGAVILPGVRIGAGALVGAGAVVTRDVAPGEVVAGNPARTLATAALSAGAGDRVPLFDPGAEHAEIGREVEAAITRVVRSGRFVGGPEIDAFETEFSAFVGGRPVAACGSGTDALRLALVAMGVGAGDEVIIPANTFTATAMAIENVGAVPVVCDVDPELYVMTAELVEPLITDATRALVPVHLFGHPAPMPELMALADSRGFGVLEDAAQAHGAVAHGRPAGAFGHAAAFSFYPSKNLGAYGDAGAVTGDPEITDRIRVLRDLGRDPDGAHIEVAVNSRLDAVQAAVLRAKLPHLAGWVRRRRELADRYRELLAGLPVDLPAEAGWAEHAYHLYVVRVPAGRDTIREALAGSDVEAGVHYPTPIHLQPAHAGRVKAPRGAPVAEGHAGRILSLPLYPQLGAEGQSRVAEALRRALQA